MLRLFLLGSLFAVGSCSFIFRAITPARCDVTGVIGCDQEDLQTCEEGFVASSACERGVCFEAGVDSACREGVCGDGALDLGEQCDDGGDIDGDACESNCTLPRCGNLILDVGEQCDDGNLLDDDACSNDCQSNELSCQTTAPTPLNSGFGCTTASSNTGRKAAVDATGRLYAAINCGGAALIVTSTDCGATFDSAGDPGIAGINELAIAGGTANRAYLAAINNSQELVFSFSTDGGASWAPPQILADLLDPAVANALSVTTDGPTVLIAIKIGGVVHLLHNTTSGEGAFALINTAQPGVFFDVLFDESSGVFLLGSDDPIFHASLSADGGSLGAFSDPGGQTFESDWTAGGGALFVSGRENTLLTIIDQGDLTTSATIDGLPFSTVERSRALDATPSGDVYIATQLGSGELQLDLVRGGSSELETRSIAPDASFPAVKTLPTQDGVLLLYTTGSTVFAKIELF
jgi:cysteine-rich repeat protein